MNTASKEQVSSDEGWVVSPAGHYL